MKAKNFGMLLLAGLFAFGLQSCDDDDDHITAPAELVAAFAEVFPNVDANAVRWEMDYQYGEAYYEAEFWENRLEKSAWFTQAYEWVMTETDHEPPFSGVPQAVTDAAQAKYPDYMLDDIDYIETPAEAYYRVEMERFDHDVYLDILADGTVLR